MKQPVKVLLLSGAATFIFITSQKLQPTHADPYPENKYPVASDIAKQKITPPKSALPIDDYLIALATAGNVNFIADVTSIPKEQMAQPFPATAMARYYHWEPKLYLTIIDMAQQNRLSQQWYDQNTFLFWKEPDAVQLARQLVKETETDPNQKLPTAVDLYNIVTKDKDLLKDFPKEGKVVDISLNELPPEQKDQAFTTIRQLFLSKETFQRAWFSDAFWKSATLHLAPLRWDDKPVLSLQVSGSYHQIKREISIIGFQAPDDGAVKPAPKN